jgi:hypothetical protein
MVIRVHDGNESREWLVPGNAEQDLVYLNVEPRPTGPIELIEPGTCRIVATASPARTGPGVLLNYWFDGDADRWVFKADVDTLLEPPRAPLASGSFCGGANATLRDAD